MEQVSSSSSDEELSDSADSMEELQEQEGWAISRFLRSQLTGATELLRFGRSAANDLLSQAKNSAIYHALNWSLLNAARTGNTAEFQKWLVHTSADINYGAQLKNGIGIPLWAEVYRLPEDDAIRQAFIVYEETLRQQNKLTAHDEFCRAIVLQDEATVQTLLNDLTSSDINGPLCPLLLATLARKKDPEEESNEFFDYVDKHLRILTMLLDSDKVDAHGYKDRLIFAAYVYGLSETLSKLLEYKTKLALTLNAQLLCRETLVLRNLFYAHSFPLCTALQGSLDEQHFRCASLLADEPDIDATSASSYGTIPLLKTQMMHNFYRSIQEERAAEQQLNAELALLEPHSHFNTKEIALKTRELYYLKSGLTQNYFLIRNLAEKGAVIWCANEQGNPATRTTLEHQTDLVPLLNGFDGRPQSVNDPSVTRLFWKMPALVCPPLEIESSSDGEEESEEEEAYIRRSADYQLFATFIFYNWALYGDSFFAGLLEEHQTGAPPYSTDLTDRMLTILQSFMYEPLMIFDQRDLLLKTDNQGEDQEEKQEEPAKILKAIIRDYLRTFYTLDGEIAFHHQMNINTPDGIGFTPFMWAGARGRVDLALFLLELPRINVNACDVRGFTALHLACLNCHPVMVRFLLGLDEITIDRKTFDIKEGEVLKPRNGVSALTLAKRRARAYGNISDPETVKKLNTEKSILGYNLIIRTFSQLHSLRRTFYLSLLAHQKDGGCPRDVCKLIVQNLHLSQVDERAQRIAQPGAEKTELGKERLSL